MKRFALALAGTAVSAFVYAQAFPPVSLRPLAWIALVPFLLALRSVGTSAALFLGWFWAVFASSFVADALPQAVETYFLQPRWLSIVFAVGVWTVTGSLYYMGFALVYRAIVRRTRGLLAAALGALAWALFELARGRLWTGSEVFTGNPWALIGYSQVGWLALVQIASLGGVYAVSFLVAWCNTSLVELIAMRPVSARLATTLPVLLVPAAGVGVAVGLGWWTLQGTPPVQSASRVAVVQGDLAVGSQWRESRYGQNLEVYLDLTFRALRDGADLVVWPESALTFLVEEQPLYRMAMARVLSAGDVELVVGAPRRFDRPDGGGAGYTNSVYLMAPDGSLRDRYDKEHLVPFAEYFPLARLDLLRRRFERVRVFEHGTATAPLSTRIGRAGVLVCNEAMLPEVARARVRAGAEWLVSPSNDHWIRDERWAMRMLDLVSLRAVETRRYLVRASTSGPSAIIDPRGRRIAQTATFSRDFVSASIRPRHELSVYTRVGDTPWLLAACALAAWLVRTAGRVGRPERPLVGV